MARAKALKMKVEDRPDVLADIASTLDARGIDVRGLHGWTDCGEAFLCLVVDDVAAAVQVLRSCGLNPEQEELLELQLANKPGALGKVARTLGEVGVHITYVFLGADGGKRQSVYLAVSDLRGALRVLT
jgi:hypothetical protein